MGDRKIPPVFTDNEIDELFDRAAEDYTDAVQIFARAKIIGIDQLLMDASKMTTYQQNQSKEDLSDVFKNLMKMRDLLLADLNTAGIDVSIGWGRTNVKPSRIEEYPDA